MRQIVVQLLDLVAILQVPVARYGPAPSSVHYRLVVRHDGFVRHVILVNELEVFEQFNILWWY